MEEASIGRNEIKDKVETENKTEESENDTSESETTPRKYLANGCTDNGPNNRESGSDENLKMVNHFCNKTVVDMSDIKANLTQIYLNHPDAFEEWLASEGNEELINKVAEIRLRQKEVKKSPDKEGTNGSEGEKESTEDLKIRRKRTERNNSVTSELFHIWVSSSPKKNKSPSGTCSDRRKQMGSLDEGDFFMELIRDVATELDIDVLCHKILINVCLLTYADRGSLFLARGPHDKRYLVAKLFDVTVDTGFEEAIEKVKQEDIRIPFGVGIVGYVAQSKEIINIKDAYKDPRFNSEIDMRTGYKTNLILSMPICNYEGDVIGVAQIINKTNGSQEFTPRDVEVFQRYLTFCGIGIQNAQLFELSVQEYKRNQILLHLARSIFEEQSNLECLVTKIMREARDLLKCERCAVYLLDLEGCSEEALCADLSKEDGSFFDYQIRPHGGLAASHESFESVRGMIEDAMIILGKLMGGEIPKDTRNEIEASESIVNGFWNTVTDRVNRWLEEARARNEEITAARGCIVEVINNGRQEATDGARRVSECVTEAVTTSTKEATPLYEAAQEQTRVFTGIITEAAGAFVQCGRNERPLQCLRDVWNEVQKNITQLQGNVVQLISEARKIYENLTNATRECVLAGGQTFAQLQRELRADVLACLRTTDRVDSTPSNRNVTIIR